MSSAVISTSAAQSRPFIFDDEADAEACLFVDTKKPASAESDITQVVHSTIKNQQATLPLIIPASRLAIRPMPEMASSGIPALDALTGGLPRGCLTEICGPASSGRTTVLLAALAAATRRGEYCALIDASDALDSRSVAAASVGLDRLLWVRCNESSPQRRQSTKTVSEVPSPSGHFISRALFEREVGRSSQSVFHFDRIGLKETGANENASRQSEHRLEQVLRATDLLLESGGFGLIILDLADIPPQSARRIPLTTWFRFRRAVEHKPTILLAIEHHPIAGSCSSLLLQLGSAKFSGQVMNPQLSAPSHAHLLTELKIHAELIRSRLNRKPARSITFETKTAWAG